MLIGFECSQSPGTPGGHLSGSQGNWVGSPIILIISLINIMCASFSVAAGKGGADFKDILYTAG